MLLVANMTKSILSLPGKSATDILGSISREFEEGFAELSESAEKELSGRRFVFNRYGRELYPYFEEADAATVPGCIIPIQQGRPVASVDSTCILIGETPRGALYAARAAVGISSEGSLKRYFRLGPILVFVSPAGISGLKVSLGADDLGLLLSDHTIAERLVRNIVERKVVDALMGSEEELIVVADGSLRHPMGQFAQGIPSGFKKRNSLVGFAKSSSLIFSEGAVTAVSKARGPSFSVLQGGPVSTVVAKFSQDGMVFRLDLAAGPEPVETVLGRMIWNDAFASGYPDSLKVAHHLSIFSKAEDQAMKAYVTRKFNLRQLPTFPLRRIALGSFKGGA